jgi:hypothetical protein
VPLIALGPSALALSAKVLIPSLLHVAQPETVRLALRSWRREIMDVLQSVQHIVLAPRVASGSCAAAGEGLARGQSGRLAGRTAFKFELVINERTVKAFARAEAKRQADE